jgi:hypothetical protein
VGNFGWDDGAITLAFSRTFAETSRIAVTPQSEVVEGFSSTAWFLVNALLQLLRPSFDTAILLSQLLSIGCLLATTLLLHRLCKAMALSPLASGMVLLCFALAGPGFAEAVNGMEMALLALAAVGITLQFVAERPSLPVLAAWLVVLVTTRFEASLYAAVLALPLLAERRYRLFLFCGVVATVIFAGLGLHRWLTFGEFLPNTILAKMHAPYSVASLLGAVRTRLSAALHLPAFVLPGLLLLALLDRARLARAFGALPRTWLHVAAPIIAAILFSLIAGRNWGYLGRMQLFALPHALLLLGALLDATAPVEKRQRRGVAALLTIVTIATSLALSFPKNAVQMARSGGFDVTPEAVRTTALRVEALRQALDRPRLTLATPDVGGSGLCCGALRLVDIALLANSTLARKGYGAIDEVLRTETPEVIEAHWTWARLSVYRSAFFAAEYRPLLIDDTRFFIRRDVAATLLAAGRACEQPTTRPDLLRRAILDHRHIGFTEIDDDFEFLHHGSVVILETGAAPGLCKTPNSLAGSAR